MMMAFIVFGTELEAIVRMKGAFWEIWDVIAAARRVDAKIRGARREADIHE